MRRRPEAGGESRSPGRWKSAPVLTYLFIYIHSSRLAKGDWHAMHFFLFFFFKRGNRILGNFLSWVGREISTLVGCENGNYVLSPINWLRIFSGLHGFLITRSATARAGARGVLIVVRPSPGEA